MRITNHPGCILEQFFFFNLKYLLSKENQRMCFQYFFVKLALLPSDGPWWPLAVGQGLPGPPRAPSRAQGLVVGSMPGSSGAQGGRSRGNSRGGSKSAGHRANSGTGLAQLSGCASTVGVSSLIFYCVSRGCCCCSLSCWMLELPLLLESRECSISPEAQEAPARDPCTSKHWKFGD